MNQQDIPSSGHTGNRNKALQKEVAEVKKAEQEAKKSKKDEAKNGKIRGSTDEQSSACLV